MEHGFHVMGRTEDHCIAVRRNVVVCFWFKQITADGVKALDALISRTCAAHPSGVAVLNVVTGTSEAPTSEVRELIGRSMKNYTSTVKCFAHVQEGSGFKAAAIRGVLTGLNLLARAPYPSKIFDQLPVAARWAHGLLPPTPQYGDADTLIRALETFRALPR